MHLQRDRAHNIPLAGSSAVGRNGNKNQVKALNIMQSLKAMQKVNEQIGSVVGTRVLRFGLWVVLWNNITISR